MLIINKKRGRKKDPSTTTTTSTQRARWFQEVRLFGRAVVLDARTKLDISVYSQKI